MNAIEVVYASAPADDIPIHTLALRHASFPGGVLFLCSGFEDIEARLETGELVTFTAAALGISLPQRALVGREDLQFALDNVTGEARQNMLNARAQGGKIWVEYRPYLESDLTQPAKPPLKMVTVSYEDDRRSANVLGSFRNFMDLEWPSLRFTPDKYPGLKYS